MNDLNQDDPLDLAAVAQDDRAIEALRAGRALRDQELALDLMRALLHDVEQALPADRPMSSGATTVAATPRPERRLARGGTVLTVVTAGLMSLGGVAAATTLAPAGSALHGLGEALRSVAGSVVGAVTPPEAAGRSATTGPPAARPTPTATVAVVGPGTSVDGATKTSPAGASVSAGVRSRAAARQVDQLLDDAADLLAGGRTAPAVSRLDLAERKLADVLSADRADLPQRLAALRAQTAGSAAATPTRSPKAARTAAPAKAEPADQSRTKRAKAGTGQERVQPSRDASRKPRA